MRQTSFISSFKRAVSILVLLALVLGGIGWLNRALRLDTGYAKNTPFIEDDREYDVLFFGSSHMVDSIVPMQLWKETGITSYNLGIQDGTPISCYWMFEMSLEYHKPKIAVMDVFRTNHPRNTPISMAHAAFDPFPLSKTKLQAIRDVYPDTASRAELLFPLDICHNRWKDLRTEMLKRGFGESSVSPQKGGESYSTVYPVKNPVLVSQDEIAPEMTRGLQYLEKFILRCREEGIIPVLTYIPYHSFQDYQPYCNAAIEYARSMGVATLDLQHMDLIDDDTDWYDSGSHANPSGAKKVTRAMGQYLKGTFDLTDNRTDAGWVSDYEDYLADRAEAIKEEEPLWQKLSLLSVEGFTANVEISSDFYMDPVTQKLLDNLGDRLTEHPLDESGHLRLTVYSPSGEEICCNTYQNSIVSG